MKHIILFAFLTAFTSCDNYISHQSSLEKAELQKEIIRLNGDLEVCKAGFVDSMNDRDLLKSENIELKVRVAKYKNQLGWYCLHRKVSLQAKNDYE